MKKFGRPGGFSLPELIVAVGVTSVGILMVIGLFIALLRSTQKSSDTSTGAVVAGSVLNEEIYDILSDTHPTLSKASFFGADSPPQAPLQGTVNLNGTVFTYEITYRTVTDTGGVPVGNGLADNRVKRADITVWWWTETAGTARKGMGFLRTNLSRLVNETADF